MKKTVITLLITTLFAICLTGCSFISVRVQEGGSAVDSGENSNEMVLYTAKLPEQYFISYEVTGEDGVVETVSKAMDLQGNIYYKKDGEYLFIRDGNSYVLYQWEDGAPVEQQDKKYQSSYIEELTKEFDEYVKKANLNTGGITEHTGEGMICDRNCNLYTFTLNVINFEQKYQFAVDQETGVCMEWESEKNISGYVEHGDGGFRCVRFDTEQEDLRKDFLENP